MAVSKVTLSSKSASKSAAATSSPLLSSGIGGGFLQSLSNTGTANLSANTVTFYASPEMEESGSTVYISLDDIRAPASLMIWMGSPSRTFSINAKLISRTQAEAAESFRQKSLLQSWRMPLGDGIAQSQVPEILLLSGYGNQFQNIPVLVQSLNITYPTDVDYISSGSSMIPIVWPINVVLREYHTKEEMADFNYSSYQAGSLPNWT